MVEKVNLKKGHEKIEPSHFVGVIELPTVVNVFVKDEM
jgi:hypothetical protein